MVSLKLEKKRKTVLPNGSWPDMSGEVTHAPSSDVAQHEYVEHSPRQASSTRQKLLFKTEAFSMHN